MFDLKLRYAPVVPIGVAEKLKETGMLGNYHLLLAHDVIKYQVRYNQVYGEIVSSGGTIIMDNSVIELGHPVGSSVMAEACNTVNANVVVLADHLLDRRKTLNASKKSLEEYHDIKYTPNRFAPAYKENIKTLFLPQGHSELDWINCLESGHELGDWIGVPRNYTEKLNLSRCDAITYTNMICPDKLVHLFGFSNSLIDDMRTCWHARAHGIGTLKGIDSASPVWMGMRNIKLSLGNYPDFLKRGDWWETANESLEKCDWELVLNNIDYIRNMINGYPTI